MHCLCYNNLQYVKHAGYGGKMVLPPSDQFLTIRRCIIGECFFMNNKVDLKQLLECGAHYGHNVRRWNPKMSPYIYGEREKVHIINLDKTVRLFEEALDAISNIAAAGGRVLMVGTKRQAASRVEEAAKKTGQYYVSHRWLGGMLTNWKTVSQSITKLNELEGRLSDSEVSLKKKEQLVLARKAEKLQKSLGGVREMGGLPSVLFVIDVVNEATAVAEANKLGIPVVGICDTNSDPSNIDYPIPANDDSIKAIDLYCFLVESAIVSGMRKGLSDAGVDIGGLENPVLEDVSVSGE